MGKSLDRTMPGARKEGLIVQELAGELLVYDRDRYKAYCLNRSGSGHAFSDRSFQISTVAKTGLTPAV